MADSDSQLPVEDPGKIEHHRQANMIADDWGQTLTHYLSTRKVLKHLGARSLVYGGQPLATCEPSAVYRLKDEGNSFFKAGPPLTQLPPGSCCLLLRAPGMGPRAPSVSPVLPRGPSPSHGVRGDHHLFLG
jgi:hypothetical protein